MMMEYILSTALAKEYLKEFNSGVITDVIITIKVELGTVSMFMFTLVMCNDDSVATN